MEAQKQIESLLEAHNAVLLRQKNGHKTYKLPNGAQFTVASTPSDHRSAANNLGTLRKLLDQPAVKPLRVFATKPATKLAPDSAIAELTGKLVEAQDEAAAARQRVGDASIRIQELEAEITRLQTLTVANALPPYDPGRANPSARLQAVIEFQEKERDRILNESAICDTRISILKALLPLATDPGFETVLAAVIPPPVKEIPTVHAIEVPPLPAPPQSIGTYVKITRDLVYAATATFEPGRAFTINDVMERMINGQDVHNKERCRIRQAVWQALNTLVERGLMQREPSHQNVGGGLRQSRFSRVAPQPAIAHEIVANMLSSSAGGM